MPHPPLKEKWLALLDDALRDGSFVKLTLSGPRGMDATLKNVFARLVDLRGTPHLSFVYRHATRDVTKNLPLEDAVKSLADLAGAEFRHAHLFSTRRTWELDARAGRPVRLIASKPVHTAPPSTRHDLAKSRVIDSAAPWLHALGVATADGTVAKGMEAKFRQINRFIELLEPLLSSIRSSRHEEARILPANDQRQPPPATPLRVVDMGCGKGYLTFAAYDWLRRGGGSDATVRGVEARPELVELGNRVAQENNFTGLTFDQGSIETAKLARVDVLIALHACDTATDDAIARGIEANASLIIVSPCCHKELRPQLIPPPALAATLRHGILRERQAEFITDALRAALLEWAGYDTKVFEFIATEHTAKNLMIAATKRGDPGRHDQPARPVRELAAFYGVRSQRLATRLNFALTTTF